MARGGIPDAPREATEQLLYRPPMADDPSDFDSISALDQGTEWPDDAPQQDDDWVPNLPSQTNANAAVPLQARGAGGKGSVGELEASVRANLMRLRAKALSYWQEFEPKLRRFKIAKDRRLKWAAGLAMLLFFTPVGDHAWASLEGGLNQVSAET